MKGNGLLSDGLMRDRTFIITIFNNNKSAKCPCQTFAVGSMYSRKAQFALFNNKDHNRVQYQTPTALHAPKPLWPATIPPLITG